jgi:hypothetical protein
MPVPATLHRMFAALAAIGLAAAPAIVPAASNSDPYDGGWHFRLTPYVWLPNINGSIDGHVLGSDLGNLSASTRSVRTTICRTFSSAPWSPARSARAFGRCSPM